MRTLAIVILAFLSSSVIAQISFDDYFSDKVFIHEFGHGFAGLADEYYSSEVAYEEFYPINVETWEPNITTMVDFDSKWKKMIEFYIK